MRRPSEHQFSTDVDQSEATALRALLENTEPADAVAKPACERLGAVIARAAISKFKQQ
jgi:hypothetical protein